MSSRVTLAQIVDNITQLSAAVKPAEFIYDFLTCFGLPKATIARLKGAGGVNLAKKEGCTLLKTKVYFEPLRADLLKAATPMQAIEAVQKDARIAAKKPRFLIATDFKKEWFSVPIGTIETAVRLLISGEIVNYRYDSATGQVLLNSWLHRRALHLSAGFGLLRHPPRSDRSSRGSPRSPVRHRRVLSVLGATPQNPRYQINGKRFRGTTNSD